MLSPNVLRGWSRGKVQGGDPERPKETMTPGCGGIFAAAPRDAFSTRGSEERSGWGAPR